MKETKIGTMKNGTTRMQQICWSFFITGERKRKKNKLKSASVNCACDRQHREKRGKQNLNKSYTQVSTSKINFQRPKAASKKQKAKFVSFLIWTCVCHVHGVGCGIDKKKLTRKKM